MKLDHPGIVKTFSVEPIEGYLMIVQELIVGTDLQKSRKKPRTHKQIAELVASIGDALAYANRQRIVHRDLKPANILMDEADRPYISDFGMALDENDQIGAPNARCGTRVLHVATNGCWFGSESGWSSRHLERRRYFIRAAGKTASVSRQIGTRYIYSDRIERPSSPAST